MPTPQQKTIIGLPLLGTNLFRRYMQSKYVNALQAAGAQVVILQPTSDAAILSGYLAQCDGFVLPGGADIEPSLYGCARAAGCHKANPLRDGMEYPLLQMILAAQKPVLCICRGIQMLNTVQGGTLHQDISGTQRYPHSDFLHRGKSTHPISIQAGTALHQLFGATSLWVNSIHHQAIDTLGDGLVCSAMSPDGYCEAVELVNYATFCIGVQWHPEHMAAKSEPQRRLFEALVHASAGGQ